MKKTTALIAVLLLAVTARAIELSLEENRGERGSVGYVDMQRLFTGSPDAQRAKESFEDLIRQAEERVNLRKAELLKLRQELDTTRLERDSLAKTMAMTPVAPPVVVPVVAPVAVPVVSTAAAAVVSTAPAAIPFATLPPAVAKSTAPAQLVPPAAIPFATLPPVVAKSTATPIPAQLLQELALPGMSTLSAAPSAPPSAAPVASSATAVSKAAPPVPATIAVSTPAASPATVAVSPKPAQAAAVPVVTSTAAAAAAAALFPVPGAAPVAQLPAGPTQAQRLLEYDAKIISIQADIAHKEADLMHEHDDADRGLLDVESRKTDQVLARLYRAVSEVARREGVSVVIDKTTILYGHPAVDLTDKVLKYLRETPAVPVTP